MASNNFPLRSIKPGDMIRVKGLLPKDHWHIVNLSNDSNRPMYDVPLHIKLINNVLTCHVRKDGKWIAQQGFTYPHLFDPNFEYLILVDATRFRLGINGKHIGDYDYQLPISSITNLHLYAKCELSSVSIESGAVTKDTYIWDLYNAVKPGDRFRLQGVYPQNSDGFAINFQNGPIYKMFDMPIAIKFDGTVVLFYTYKNGKWLDAETHPATLIHGGKFNIEICCEASQFKLVVGGTHIGNFQHRLATSDIRHLTVTPDVLITSLSTDTGC